MKKHKLDQQAESKLCDVLSRWDEEKQYRPEVVQNEM